MNSQFQLPIRIENGIIEKKFTFYRTILFSCNYFLKILRKKKSQNCKIYARFHSLKRMYELF